MSNKIKNFIIFFLLIFVFILWFLVLKNSKDNNLWEKNIENKKEQKNFLEKKDQKNSQNLEVKKQEKKHFCQQFIDKKRYYKVWSKTNPKINETHIFCWEINSRWKASWFHSKYNNQLSPTIIIDKIDKKNNFWVYTAKIKVKDLKKWDYKTKFSSIYPDKFSSKEIEKMIINAWENKYFYKHSKFRWPSGKWFDIEGYSLNWKINTAYPIYKK